jgi:outer membrane protein insertion porin family
MKKLAYLAYLIVLVFISSLSIDTFAQQSFVVRRIEFQGLEHISPLTAENYLPIKRGQTLKPAKTAAILRSLYKTGFFDHISLSKEDNTLIIHVTERPTIGQLKVTGNSVIPTDKLTPVMTSLDIAEGRVYNPSVIEKVKQSLLNQYYQLGRYNARVDVSTSPMPRNRVAVKITISEGLIAKIRRISILGNHAFSEKTLINQLDITTSGILTVLTQTDRYSEARLEESIDKLRSYYLDHGYIRIQVKSSQAAVTPDRKSVYISIVVEEGQPYTVNDYHLEGQLILPREDYVKLIQVKPGATFSRQKVLDSEKAISDMLGDKGYMFATISLRPQMNDQTHQVTLIFDVKPGKRAYIRHVTFTDNNRTNDVVLRREIQQMEAAPASTSRLENSKHRLLLLPYIKEAEMSVKPVPEADDQVDVNYKVKEESSATASFKIGYSQIYRTTLGLGLNQKNFFGTGNTLGINLTRSKYEQFYGIDYTDPYYTEDGISRTFNFAISRVDPRGAGVSNGYTTHEYNAGVVYGIPIGQEIDAINRVQIGVSYQNTLVNLVRGETSNQINSFVNQHGHHFQEADLRIGYSRDSRDKAIFPTKGTIQTIYADGFAPLDRNSLTFYTLNYSAKWYQPLTDQFILLTTANLGYGNGFHGASDYPFFRNYYAGGIDTVRGYQGYSLGPRDSNFKPFGGNELIDGSVGLIFPNFISNNLRTMAYVDAGNVYSTLNNRGFGGQSTTSGPLRYSAGVEADWLTPFGPIRISLAQPLNKRPHDEQKTFDFALGANF